VPEIAWTVRPLDTAQLPPLQYRKATPFIVWAGSAARRVLAEDSDDAIRQLARELRLVVRARST
jgi:hypothetical protein